MKSTKSFGSGFAAAGIVTGILGASLLAAAPAMAALPWHGGDAGIQTWKCQSKGGAVVQPFTVQIRKADAETAAPLAGASFRVTTGDIESRSGGEPTYAPVGWSPARDVQTAAMEAEVIATQAAYEAAYAVLAQAFTVTADANAAHTALVAAQAAEQGAVDAATVGVTVAEGALVNLEEELAFLDEQGFLSPEQLARHAELTDVLVPAAQATVADTVAAQTDALAALDAAAAAVVAHDAVVADAIAAQAAAQADSDAAEATARTAWETLATHNEGDLSIRSQTVTTDATGSASTSTVEVCGVTDGVINLTLEETAAPASYIGLDAPVTVSIAVSQPYDGAPVSVDSIASSDDQVEAYYSGSQRPGPVIVTLDVTNEPVDVVAPPVDPPVVEPPIVVEPPAVTPPVAAAPPVAPVAPAPVPVVATGAEVVPSIGLLSAAAAAIGGLTLGGLRLTRRSN
ncbi:hypothetical protein LG299_12490 [Microbacterium lacus]|uniref:hypothetical protein n=1 Tax=Microbacterium lacus TaxID=415217 RepID=UPI00384C7062